jgi:hypothetical protein
MEPRLTDECRPRADDGAPRLQIGAGSQTPAGGHLPDPAVAISINFAQKDDIMAAVAVISANLAATHRPNKTTSVAVVPALPDVDLTVLRISAYPAIQRDGRVDRRRIRIQRDRVSRHETVNKIGKQETTNRVNDRKFAHRTLTTREPTETVLANGVAAIENHWMAGRSSHKQPTDRALIGCELRFIIDSRTRSHSNGRYAPQKLGISTTPKVGRSGIVVKLDDGFIQEIVPLNLMMSDFLILNVK